MSFSNRINLFLATGFGIGFAPQMPGTFGSVWGIVLVGLAYGLQIPSSVAIGINLVLLVVGIPICSRGEKILKQPDPGAVVWDELAAVPILFWIFYLFPTTTSPYWIALLGFGWFRLFDILKPFPIKWFERLGGGTGIMADDIIAALYATAAFYLSCWSLGLISV
ncbi:Phosphatidylglycerophosphatase A [hydrothermal vent metagenome]|uniref:Phosphatidylglycerophosphatase A n=1 Tax=hydrothermal vent metagenome TaxID=652676 RepID=A0A3B1DFF5_9ZZZZ